MSSIMRKYFGRKVIKLAADEFYDLLKYYLFPERNRNKNETCEK